jgi:lipopolysaccharide export system permease protein
VFTIGAVTRYSEITAAKASGVSFYRFIAPIFVGAAGAMVLGLGLGALAPSWNAKRMAIVGDTHCRARDGRTRFAYAGENGRVYKAAQLVVDSGSMIVVEVERKGTGPDYPTQLIAASNAKWGARRGWTLHDGTLHLLPSDTVDAAFAFDSLADRRMVERPRDFMQSPKAPEDMGYRELGRFIAAQERAGTDVNALRVARMLKITIPVTCVIILLFGAPLATSTQRGGAAFGVGLSLVTTVIFLVLIQLTRAVGGKGLLPPELAAWIPSILFGSVGVVLLARTRT